MSEEKFECHNCGNCCGPVPITYQERDKIQRFLKSHPDIAREAKQKALSLTCVFRDKKNKKCLIYSCRPEICKLFQCSNNDWEKLVTVPKNSKQKDFPFINECFGADMNKAIYRFIALDFINKARNSNNFK